MSNFSQTQERAKHLRNELHMFQRKMLRTKIKSRHSHQQTIACADNRYLLLLCNQDFFIFKISSFSPWFTLPHKCQHAQHSEVECLLTMGNTVQTQIKQNPTTIKIQCLSAFAGAGKTSLLKDSSGQLFHLSYVYETIQI